MWQLKRLTHIPPTFFDMLAPTTGSAVMLLRIADRRPEHPQLRLDTLHDAVSSEPKMTYAFGKQTIHKHIETR